MARRPAPLPRRIAEHVQSLRLVREVTPVRTSFDAGETPIRSPRDAYHFVAPLLEPEDVEVFGIIVLDSQHRAKAGGFVSITRGVLNSSLVHPREVFRAAIVASAAAIILVHNHPSGDPTPSGEDRLVTDQLVAAGRLLDLPVHDHIIVGRGRYTSFAEAGLIAANVGALF